MKHKIDLLNHRQLAGKLEEQIHRHGLFNPKLKIFGHPVRQNRLQTVGHYGGVEYINDAGAQSVDATYFSMNQLQGPLIWIVCNDNPATPFRELSQVMVYKTRHIIACGQAARTLEELFGSRIPVSAVAGAAEAVKWAARIAPRGTQVLFSPATAYDRYDTENLALAFKNAVKKLGER